VCVCARASLSLFLPPSLPPSLPLALHTPLCVCMCVCVCVYVSHSHTAHILLRESLGRGLLKISLLYPPRTPPPPPLSPAAAVVTWSTASSIRSRMDSLCSSVVASAFAVSCGQRGCMRRGGDEYRPSCWMLSAPPFLRPFQVPCCSLRDMVCRATW
jgi:hypothetical protein